MTEHRVAAFPPPVSPEWELILLLVQPHQETDHVPAIRARLASPLDWRRCRRLAAAHGVSSLVYRRLIPLVAPTEAPEIWGQWAADHESESRRNLARLVELRRIVEAYDQRKIPVLVVKGPVLGVCLYGDVALRPFGDLDLVIPVEERERAIACLEELGFVPQFQLTPSERARFFQRYSALNLTSSATGTVVDLHWELVSPHYRFARSLDGYWKRAATAQIGGLQFQTLSSTDLFVFLLLHAAQHEWRCLGWLVDLAWLQAHPGPLSGEHWHGNRFHWDELQRDAVELGFGRFVTIGRQLCEQLFGIPGPGRGDTMTAAGDPLVAEIIDGMTRDVEVFVALRRWPWQRIYFRALDRAADRARYVYDTLLAPTPLEWKILPLPTGLTWLYFVIRICRLLVKHIGRTKPE